MQKISPQFLALVGNSLKFRMFLLTKLPAAFFSGIRLVNFTESQAETEIRYGWFTRNPFRSVYFASMAMAAEMSTGVLALGRLYGLRPPVSMLVVKMEANYFKKATGAVRFVCRDGERIYESVQEAVKTGEGVELTVESEGRNEAGELVATFAFTWSFKQKQNR